MGFGTGCRFAADKHYQAKHWAPALMNVHKASLSLLVQRPSQ